MRPAKIVAIVVGALLVLIGLALVAPGGFLLWAHGTQRDSSGFFETSSRAMSTTGYALTTPDIDVNFGSDMGYWVPAGTAAEVRISATPASGSSLFIGIGPSDQVSQYLAGVGYDEVTNLGWRRGDVKYRHVDGDSSPAPPGTQDFWVAQTEGTGIQALEWDVRDGRWTAVLMNSDASAQVVADVRLGARFGILLPIGIGLTAAGFVLLGVGVLLIVLGARPSRRPAQAPPPAPAPTAAGVPPQS